jgi:hypothetical protein
MNENENKKVVMAAAATGIIVWLIMRHDEPVFAEPVEPANRLHVTSNIDQEISVYKRTDGDPLKIVELAYLPTGEAVEISLPGAGDYDVDLFYTMPS